MSVKIEDCISDLSKIAKISDVQTFLMAHTIYVLSVIKPEGEDFLKEFLKREKELLSLSGATDYSIMEEKHKAYNNL